MTQKKFNPMDKVSLLRRNLPATTSDHGTAAVTTTAAPVSQAHAVAGDLLAARPDQESFILFVDQIEPDPEQPRDDFDSSKTQAHIAELAAAIENEGQIDPVVVVPIGNNRYQLRAGECRWRAIKDVLKEDRIRATIRPLNQDDLRHDLIRLNSNDKRRDLNKVQLARQYAQIQQRYGWDDSELAAQVKKSKQYISAVKKVLKAPEAVQQALADGRLSWRAWVRDSDEVMRDFESGFYDQVAARGGASDKEPDAAVPTAGRAKKAATKESANITLDENAAREILGLYKDIIEEKELDIEIPRNPTRRQLSEFLVQHARKVRRARR